MKAGNQEFKITLGYIEFKTALAYIKTCLKTNKAEEEEEEKTKEEAETATHRGVTK